MQASELPLKPIHLPETIGWWPPAMGWWLLLVLLPSLILLGFWRYKRHNQDKRILKFARKRLEELKNDVSLDGIQKLSRLSVLLRRVAMTVSNDPTVAGLTGQDWLAYLDQTMKDSPFTEGAGRLLIAAPYKKSPPTETDIGQLLELCERWLKTCQKLTKP